MLKMLKKQCYFLVRAFIGASAVTLITTGAACDVPVDNTAAGGSDVEIRTSALTSDSHELFVAAYYGAVDSAPPAPQTNTLQWDAIVNQVPPPKFVVISGPNSGPPYTTADVTNYNAVIARLRGTTPPITVLGYVDNPYGKDVTVIQADVNQWHTHLNNIAGIYFDDTNRTSAQHDLPRAEQFAMDIRSWGGYAVFSFGAVHSFFQYWVDCISDYSGSWPVDDANSWTRFVTAEEPVLDYLNSGAQGGTNLTANMFAASENQWVKSYLPVQFINLVYRPIADTSTVTTTKVDDIMTNSTAFNAKGIFIQDYNATTNYWGKLMPTTTVWNRETADAPAVGNPAYPGTNTGGGLESCPEPNTCRHDLCSFDGQPLAAACDWCVNYVCIGHTTDWGPDPYCCNTAWDGICGDEAIAWCGSSCAYEY
jgi:Spherulation-specific family 4